MIYSMLPLKFKGDMSTFQFEQDNGIIRKVEPPLRELALFVRPFRASELISVAHSATDVPSFCDCCRRMCSRCDLPLSQICSHTQQFILRSPAYPEACASIPITFHMKCCFGKDGRACSVMFKFASMSVRRHFSATD